MKKIILYLVAIAAVVSCSTVDPSKVDSSLKGTVWAPDTYEEFDVGGTLINSGKASSEWKGMTIEFKTENRGTFYGDCDFSYSVSGNTISITNSSSSKFGGTLTIVGDKIRFDRMEEYSNGNYRNFFFVKI